MTPKRPVFCPSCGWQSERAYVPLETFALRHELHLGFGRCRKCDTLMQRRVIGEEKQARIRAEMAHWDEVTRRGR